MNLYDPTIRKVEIYSLPVEQYVCVQTIPPNLEKHEFVKLVERSKANMYLACVIDIDNEADCFWLSFDRSNPLWAT